jgi:hypothetical protein
MIVNVDAKSWHGNTIRNRFESKINKTNSCWLWTAGLRGNNKYGGFRINKTKVMLAHNVAYELYKGNRNNLKVLHTCDNPLCVNPNHLFLGTQLDNIKDRDMKQRQRNRYSVKQLGKACTKKEGSI